MAKRRKSTRRRSTRRRRSLGAVPVYPPTLLATGMPAPALTVGPMLGSPPDEHSRRAEMLEQSMKDQLAHGETLAIRGDCELALYKLVAAANNGGSYVSERMGAGQSADANKVNQQISKLRDRVTRCFVQKNK